MKSSDEELNPRQRCNYDELFPTILKFQYENKNKAVLLTRGVDYHCSEGSINTSLYAWAKKKGLRIATKTKDLHGAILVKFFAQDGSELETKHD